MSATTTTTSSFPPLPPRPNPTTSPLSSDSDATSGSDADDPSPLETSILSAYLQASSLSSSSPDLSKIRSFLSSSSRRSFAACLICLDPARHSDPVWSCSSGCHALFHLICIQNWANQSSLLPKSANSPNWHCPKCRLPIPRTLIPKSYLCFCGKLENPPSDPWILPHSCGEVCDRPLKPHCGHRCLLLCHPGPCPPCPNFITARCFCGHRSDVRRCAQKQFSCSNPCPKPLRCRSHRCPEKCHDGPCPPCRVKGRFRCACGKTEEERECFESGFRCERKCDGVLGCGKHGCDRGCHSGECGACPLRGKRTCPCGKKEYKGVACDVDVPTCGSTCEKVLGCGRHKCPERCHRGLCVETCRTVVVKSCRCGSLKKEVPCYQDLVCERKCQRVRDCGRHACKRRCCDGDCLPCQEVCGRKLRCNNHKCPSPCHRLSEYLGRCGLAEGNHALGACAPCPLMVTISCACGETHFEVPCGIEKNQKPPKCRKPCRMSRLCRHKSECRPHKCHYGACPPCRLVCGEEFPCGHACKQRCHGPLPPPNPEFTLKPKKKKTEKPIECIPGSRCPPCTEIVLISCYGRHIGQERAMICSQKMGFSCQNLCDNPLSCGNHYCSKICHVKSASYQNERQENLQEQVLSLDGKSGLAEPCEKCLFPCQKARETSCSHPCPLPCHPGDCPSCKALVKRACHCGSMVHVFECSYYNSLGDKKQLSIRSCGGPCHKKLPNCPHLCSEICHPGECPSFDQCNKKVTVRCACNNLKKEWLCQDVLTAYRNAGRDPKEVLRNQFGVGLLPCNAECMSKVKVVDSELQPRKAKVTKNVVVEAANVPKRRKRRERVQEIGQVSRFQGAKIFLQRFLLFVLLFLVISAIAYYGYKGVFWLSDWMNKIEEKQQRRYPRI